MTKEFINSNNERLSFSDERLKFYKELVRLWNYSAGHREKLYIVMSNLLKSQNASIPDDAGMVLSSMAEQGMLMRRSIQKGFWNEYADYVLRDKEFFKFVFRVNNYDRKNLLDLKIIEKKIINNREVETIGNSLYDEYNPKNSNCLIL
jgi:hypothetical protein